MERKYEQLEDNKGLVSLQFTAEEFSVALKWAYNKNKGGYQLHGFRKGRVPMKVLVAHYGEDIFYDDAVNHLVNPAYIELINKEEIKPVSQAEINIKSISAEEGLDVELSFDLEPEAELGQYKGVKAVKPAVEVSEADVNAEIERVQERNSRLVPVEDRAAEDGDTVIIDFEGFQDGEAFDGGKGEDHELELGSGSFIPGFEEQIVGHNIDDEFDVNVTFPEDYGSEDLAGADAVFKVKLNGIKVKELPELDDDFAMDISEFDTFEEYKESIREELAKSKEDFSTKEFENNVLSAVIENMNVDIPESMIEAEVDHLYGHQEQDFSQYGITLADYLSFSGQTLEDFKETLRPAAENQVKLSLALKAVIKAEELELTDEDREIEVQNLVEQTGLTAEEVRERLEGNANVEQNALLNKAVRFLTDNAEEITAEEAIELNPELAEETSEEE